MDCSRVHTCTYLHVDIFVSLAQLCRAPTLLPCLVVQGDNKPDDVRLQDWCKTTMSWQELRTAVQQSTCSNLKLFAPALMKYNSS